MFTSQALRPRVWGWLPLGLVDHPVVAFDPVETKEVSRRSRRCFATIRSLVGPMLVVVADMKLRYLLRNICGLARAVQLSGRMIHE